MNTEIDQIVIIEPETKAKVIAIIGKGTFDNNSFEGVFRNNCIWKKETDQNWCLVNWRNEKTLFITSNYWKSQISQHQMEEK